MHRLMRTCIIALVLGLVGFSLAAHAATLHCGAGDVPCLITAIHTANTNGESNTLTLAAGTYTLTAVDNGAVGNGNGLPVLTGTLTITGQGADATILERATTAPAFRFLEVAATGTLTLEHLTLQHGYTYALVTGGAINNAGKLTLRQSILTRNSGRAAALYNTGELTLMQSTVMHNARGDEAGGIQNDGGTVTITNSLLTMHGVPHETGGLLNRAGTVMITGTTFSYNVSDAGPAIYNQGDMRIANSSVTANFDGFIATGTIVNVGLLEITNTTFMRNVIYGSSAGSALYNGDTATLTNVTIADNIAEWSQNTPSGSAVHSAAIATTILTNTLLARNIRRPNDGRPIVEAADCSGPTISLGHNLLGTTAGCAITLHPTDRTGDPGLGTCVETGQPGRDYCPLLPGSPAINGGHDAACPVTDQLGQPRVGRCDIGAVEFQGPRTTPPLVQQIGGDLDGNGTLDTAGLTASGELWVKLGTAAWKQIPAAPLRQIVAGDFDARGHEQFVVLDMDAYIYLMDDVQAEQWRWIPGRLKAMVTVHGWDGQDHLAGVDWLRNIWQSGGLGAWYLMPGQLDWVIAGDFTGAGYDQLAGISSFGTLWWTPDNWSWYQLPGLLQTIETVPGQPDGMQGVGLDGVQWYAASLGAWQPLPQGPQVAQQ
jgi:hypothetical protein